MKTLPHPIPYQGSKRKLAPQIMKYIPSDIENFYEPFAGSAAITIASSYRGDANFYEINDKLKPLIELWKMIVNEPGDLCQNYKSIWEGQHKNPKTYYNSIRSSYNKDKDPCKLLFLLSRCVKNAVRFNDKGEFNQSPDNRRLGRKPDTMEKNIKKASNILKNKIMFRSDDYSYLLDSATKNDFIYMDPPYMGTSKKKDPRYYESLNLSKFVEFINELDRKGIKFLVSFDGRHGNKTYGPGIPNFQKKEIFAGVSSQATLNGNKVNTYESLYFSSSLLESIKIDELMDQGQLTLFDR